jgi:subfamily B ATP-binding cassette protein MsbA
MNNFEILKRLYRDYTKKFRHKILLSIFFTSLVAGATASIAYLLDPAIEKLFVEKDQTLLLIIPALIIFSFALKGSSLYLAKVIMISIAEDIRAIIQADMVNSLIEADTDYIDDKHTGKFISNLTYDTGLITNLVSTAILNFFKDSLTLIALLGVMFFQNWKLSLFAIIMIPLSSFVAKNLGKRIGKVTNEAQIFSGILTSHFIEIFKNHKIIKIFQQEENEKSKLVIFIDDLKEKVKKISIIYVRATPIMETLTGIMIAGLIFYSGKLILRNEIEINNFFSFLAAMMLAYQPVRSLATLNMTINQGLSAAKRILPIIDNKKEISENKNSFQLEIDKGNIKFENVTFGYKTDPRNVLKSINLEIIGGKMNALVGHSGAGKTTILNLIPRFFNCKDGDILIDNQSIYNVTVKSLRKNISLVSQDTTLFDNTIRNNISYANIKASDEEIIEASKKAEAHDFIEKLPYKYDTQIGEDGVRLSGGEKQRLSIARAILKKTPIILLDEATSSLDAETEDKIQKGLNYLTKNKTTLVIAHRLSTILNCEKIFVLDKGQVVAEGNHSELLKNSPIYKNFYEKQIRKE